MVNHATPLSAPLAPLSLWSPALSVPTYDSPLVPTDLPYDPGAGWGLRFGCVFIGQALSLVGSALTQFVLLWWITDTTGSVSALALAGIAALLPQAIFSPFGGVLADRYSRRIIMIAADSSSALCMLVLIGLFLAGGIEIWHAYILLGIRGAMQAFQSPAAMSSTAMLVPTRFLSRAAGLNQTLIGLMTIAAAPLGALAIAVMPIGLALSIDVGTAVLGIFPLLLFQIPQPVMPSVQRTGIWLELQVGVKLIWDHPGLRRLYALLGVVVLVIMPSFTLMPLLVKEHFGGGPMEVASMEGVAGAAMIAAGLALTTFSPKRHIIWVLWGFAASCFALALAALAPGNLLWVAVIWWALSGAAFIVGDAPLMTLLQSTVPKHQQGRVLSLLSTVMMLAGPVGLALASPVGELIGMRWLFVLMGLVAGCISLLGFWSSAVLQIGRPRH